MRVFVAIELSEDAKRELIRAQSELKGAKLTLTKEFHLTLKFLGEVSEGKAGLIKDKLKEIEFNKSKIKLSQTGVFPSPSHITVVWVGLEPAKPLIDLNTKINQVLQEFKDDHPFHPHITLARVKFIENKKEFADKLKEIKIKPVEFEAKEFKLIKSTLTPNGPVYEDLAVFA